MTYVRGPGDHRSLAERIGWASRSRAEPTFSPVGVLRRARPRVVGCRSWWSPRMRVGQSSRVPAGHLRPEPAAWRSRSASRGCR